MERNSVLKLFGVELDPSPLHERDESASLLSPPSTVGTPSPPPPTAKKFKCSNCFKIFANPQALGGHQNAHKKEKMRRKTMQLQARKASCLNYYYINPFFNNYDQSSSNLNKEVQISFGSNNLDKNDYEYKVRCNNNNNNYVSVQENNKRRFIVRSSSSSPESKRICSRKGLDLHLGLGL